MILFWGALFSSRMQSLVLEYKRKKSAFVLAEFNSPQMSDFLAHMHTKLLCCVNEKSVLKAKAPNICMCLYCVGRFCTAIDDRLPYTDSDQPGWLARVGIIVGQAGENKGTWRALDTMLGQVMLQGHTQKADTLLLRLQGRGYEGISEGLGVRAGCLLSHLACTMVRFYLQTRGEGI